MVRRLFPLLLCTLALVSGCSKPTQESLTKDEIAKMKELAAVLHGVTDESSAKSAVDKVKSISADMKKIQADMNALPKPTDAEAKKILTDNEKEMSEAFSSLTGEVMRISMNPTLSKPLDAAMKDVGSMK